MAADLIRALSRPLGEIPKIQSYIRNTEIDELQILHQVGFFQLIIENE